MSMPRIATRMNHVAYPTFDTAATVRVYTEVMGFRLVDAVQDAIGRTAFLHTFFAMESGEIIAFFDVPGLAKPTRDSVPPWVRHLAMSVDSAETLAAWKARLEAHGLGCDPPRCRRTSDPSTAALRRRRYPRGRRSTGPRRGTLGETLRPRQSLRRR